MLQPPQAEIELQEVMSRFVSSRTQLGPVIYTYLFDIELGAHRPDILDLFLNGLDELKELEFSYS